MMSLYLPGTSPVHRMRSGPKLLVLTFLGTVVVIASRPSCLLFLLGGVLTIAGVARLPFHMLWRHLRPVWPWLAGLLCYHAWATDVATGAVAVLRLAVVLVAAAVVTATTRVSDLVGAVERVARPLRLFGVDPARIGLVVAMTLRFIPLLTQRAARIREAQAARGGNGRSLTILVPLLVQVLRLAHDIGEAMDARGAGTPGQSALNVRRLGRRRVVRTPRPAETGSKHEASRQAL